MYSLSSLWRGLKRGRSNPALFAREANRLYYRRLYRRDYNPDGVDVVAADWDTLAILDACRYDLFERCHDLPGRLERRQSRGSHTVEFLQGNFDGRELLDTVYVTASPQLRRWRDRVDVTFHDTVDVWREDGWDEEHYTVLPETVTEYALDAAEEYPNKRLIVHYLQPHYPFLDAGAELNTKRFGADEEGPDIWALLNRNETDADPDAVQAAYRRNLECALPAVEELIDGIEGRTVVTSDHGNLLGERAAPLPVREWGHPPGIHVPQLVDVPWLVHESGRRRDVVAEPAAEREGEADPDDSVTRERLAALGYVE